jgi:hypothetical protein
MPENKTLTFPPKSEWPTLTDADWASNRRHAFLKFKRLLLSMLTTLDFVVGNENYGGEWALIYDTAARKAHKTYPPPTSAPQAGTSSDPALLAPDPPGHFFRTTVLRLSLTILRPARMTTNLCRTTMATLTASLEKWANNTADQWNRLSPYDDQLRSTLPRFLQMLDHQIKSRKMANLDRIDCGEFKAYLNKNEQWLAKKDIPVYMSSLLAFSSSQLEALADAEGMTGTASSSKRGATAAFADPNDNSKRQRFEQWGAQVAASINGDSANPQGSSSACSFCGRHHSLAQCRGVQNLIAQHKSRQLAARGGTSKPPFHRGNSWRTKKPVQFGTRARPPFADRSGRNGGGNGGDGSNSGGRGGHWGNGHHSTRGSKLGARPVMTLAGTSNVEVSPLALLLAFILTTSLCPSRGTMLLCARLSKLTSRPPTSSVLQSTLPRARSLWSLLPLSAASSWLLSPTTTSPSEGGVL